jgi:hypothetical protein
MTNLFGFQNASSTTIASVSLVTGGGITSSLGGTSYNSLWIRNTWAQMWLHLVVNSTTGVLAVQVNGVTAFTLTSQNTGSFGAAKVFFGAPYSQGYCTYFDNFWVMDTTGSHSNSWPVGRMSIQSCYPTADGTYQGWTPLSGTTHYTQVNQAQADDDTTYNFATTPGTEDSYTIQSLTQPFSQIHAVQASAVIRKDDVPAKTAHVIAKSGSTVSETADIAVPLTYTSELLLMPDDPNTTSQWTTSAVNSMEVGVKVIA